VTHQLSLIPKGSFLLQLELSASPQNHQLLTDCAVSAVTIQGVISSTEPNLGRSSRDHKHFLMTDYCKKSIGHRCQQVIKERTKEKTSKEEVT
jgi:hypothetical protein